jgi:hypothetical protein
MIAENSQLSLMALVFARRDQEIQINGAYRGILLFHGRTSPT